MTWGLGEVREIFKAALKENVDMGSMWANCRKVKDTNLRLLF